MKCRPLILTPVRLEDNFLEWCSGTCVLPAPGDSDVHIVVGTLGWRPQHPMGAEGTH